MILASDVYIATWLKRYGIHNVLMCLARVLMAYLFIKAGWGKIGSFEKTASFMQANGLPSALLGLIILLEFGGGLAILLGFQSRVIALFLAVFCIVSGMIFHALPADATHLMKNLAMAGGFLYLFTQGPGRWSLDSWLGLRYQKPAMG